MSIRRSIVLALAVSALPGLAAAQDNSPAIADPPERGLASPMQTRQTAELTYFLHIEGKQWGPYTVAQLRELAANKNFFQDDLVWKEGATKWIRAQDYPELAVFALANEQPPAPEFKPQAAAEPGEAKPADPEPEAAVQEAVTPDAGPDVPPPPPDADKTPEPARQYFVSVDGAATGPFGLDEIKAKVASGEIATGTYIWWKGGKWTQAEAVAELSSTFAEKPTAPPFDCAGFIPGLWERNSFYSGQPVSLRIRYDSAGQYSGSQSMAGLPGSTLYGTWTTKAVGAKACSLTLNQQYPDTSNRTLVFDIIDRDTMKDQSDEGIARRL